MLRICQAADTQRVGVLIDAEETWIQDPVDVLTILMMEKFNRGRVTVYNTIQLYRHDRLAFLKDSWEAAVQRDFILGAKLVRGRIWRKSESVRRSKAMSRRSSPVRKPPTGIIMRRWNSVSKI